MDVGYKKYRWSPRRDDEGIGRRINNKNEGGGDEGRSRGGKAGLGVFGKQITRRPIGKKKENIDAGENAFSSGDQKPFVETRGRGRSFLTDIIIGREREERGDVLKEKSIAARNFGATIKSTGSLGSVRKDCCTMSRFILLVSGKLVADRSDQRKWLGAWERVSKGTGTLGRRFS